jgi:hypothetical protein
MSTNDAVQTEPQLARLPTEKEGWKCVLWSLFTSGAHIRTNDMALRASSLNPGQRLRDPIMWQNRTLNNAAPFFASPSLNPIA